MRPKWIKGKPLLPVSEKLHLETLKPMKFNKKKNRNKPSKRAKKKRRK